jgi:hypothetical protein
MGGMSFADAHLGFTLLRLLNEHQIRVIFDVLDGSPVVVSNGDVAAINRFLEEVECDCGEAELVTHEVRFVLERLLAQCQQPQISA